MRKALLFATGALGAALSLQAAAQAFPTKPLRVIVPYPAGGIVDLMARSPSDGLAAKPHHEGRYHADAAARSQHRLPC